MKIHLEEYLIFLTELVNLQQVLVQLFEKQVEITPPPDNFLKTFEEGELKTVFNSNDSVSSIISNWPSGRAFIPLVVWTRPRIGIVQLKNQDWVFSAHGQATIQFVGLPFGLSEEVLQSFRDGKIDTLLNLPEYGPEVDVVYSDEGRTDGISATSVYDFARSSDSKFKKIIQADHQELLETMAQKSLLICESKEAFYLK